MSKRKGVTICQANCQELEYILAREDGKQQIFVPWTTVFYEARQLLPLTSHKHTTVLTVSNHVLYNIMTLRSKITLLVATYLNKSKTHFLHLRQTSTGQ
jgi:hypothetical protein